MKKGIVFILVLVVVFIASIIPVSAVSPGYWVFDLVSGKQPNTSYYNVALSRYLELSADYDTVIVTFYPGSTSGTGSFYFTAFNTDDNQSPHQKLHAKNWSSGGIPCISLINSTTASGIVVTGDCEQYTYSTSGSMPSRNVIHSLGSGYATSYLMGMDESSGGEKFVWVKGNVYDGPYSEDIFYGGSGYKSVTIRSMQQINFLYGPEDASDFLLSIDSDDGCISYMQYTLNGEDATGDENWVVVNDSIWNRIDKSDYPEPRVLNPGEVLSFHVGGGVLGAVPRNLTFVFDDSLCQYSVTSRNTGLVIDPGNMPEGTPIADTGRDVLLTEDTGISRDDFQEGIIGDIQYNFAILFEYIKMPFTIVTSFFANLGDVVKEAASLTGGLTSALQSLYSILPAQLAWLLTAAITFMVLKLLFGR